MRRREFLTSAVAIALTCPASRGAWAFEQPFPPVARRGDTVDRKFGMDLPDPYRWMENPDDDEEEWETFVRGQAAYARVQLDTLPDRASIAERVSSLSGESTAVHTVQRTRLRTFVEARPVGTDTYKLYVLDAAGTNKHLLFDPAAETQDGESHMSLDYWTASPNGKFVAIGTSRAGTENTTLRIMRCADGRMLPVEFDRAQYAEPAWTPDSKGLFMSRLKGGIETGDKNYFDNSEVWYYKIGAKQETAERIVGGGDVVAGYRIAANEFPSIVADSGSDWVLLKISGAVRRHNPVFAVRYRDLQKGISSWQPAILSDQQCTDFTLSENDVYYVSERGAPNGRILKTSLAKSESADPEVVVEESDQPIESPVHRPIMVAARDGVYFLRSSGGVHSVHRIDPMDRESTIATPFDAGIAELVAASHLDGIDAVMGGWLHETSVWSYKGTSGRFVPACTGFEPGTSFDNFESFRIIATTRDKVRLPVTVIAPKGLARNGGARCLVHCYGAYGSSIRPHLNRRAIALLESGGVYVHVHARGGGEFGSTWWRAGKKQSKPNTWRDLIDGCRALVENGITSPDRLTISGSSAGGVAVGRALTESPSLFAGAILNVAFTNPTRIGEEPSGASQMVEFGDPSVESGFRALYAMDTYQHVRDGVEYPPVLIMHGESDVRVSVWQSAKLAAKFQHLEGREVQTLLRIAFDAGHGTGSTRTQIDERWTDMIAFVLSRG